MSEEELIAYRSFRTGLTFLEVRQMFWSYSEDPNDWPQVTRHTVLGLWRQLKLEMWERCKPERFREDEYEINFS